MSKFWKRYEYKTGESRGPWVAVPEWGHAEGRLHLHMGVSWWDRLRAVEVCTRCARPALLQIRDDVLSPAQLGSRPCVGCLWGHGFVGRPEVLDAGGDTLAGYCAKYLAKDFGVDAGRQRYRVGEGYQPERVQVDCESAAEAWEAAEVLCGGPALSVVSSSEWSGWVGPPVWVMDWRTDRRAC